MKKIEEDCLVQYIGGQDEVGKEICELEEGGIYLVRVVSKFKFHGTGMKPAIGLHEFPKFTFLMSMFKRLNEPFPNLIENLLEQYES